MFQSKLEKAPTKAEMEKKVEAWKTVNAVLVESNSKFMRSLRSMLEKEEKKQEELKELLEKKEGSEDINLEYVYTGGRVDMLREILGIRNAQVQQ